MNCHLSWFWYLGREEPPRKENVKFKSKIKILVRSVLSVIETVTLASKGQRWLTKKSIMSNNDPIYCQDPVKRWWHPRVKTPKHIHHFFTLRVGPFFSVTILFWKVLKIIIIFFERAHVNRGEAEWERERERVNIKRVPLPARSSTRGSVSWPWDCDASQNQEPDA